MLPTEQLVACDTRRDPPRLIFGEQLGRRRRSEIIFADAFALPIPRHPTKRPICLRTKDPSPKCWGLCYVTQIAAKREDIFKAAIDGRSRAAWASLASPTCHRNGPGSAKCSVFPRTDPVSNPVSTNTGLRRGETEFSWAETKEPK
jgi:hypothetical protein